MHTHRNGYKSEFGSIGPAHLKTAEDRLLVQKPQVGDAKHSYEHRKFITSTNLVERSFLEEKRRSPAKGGASSMRKVG
jgi:hypothetical protein